MPAIIEVNMVTLEVSVNRENRWTILTAWNVVGDRVMSCERVVPWEILDSANDPSTLFHLMADDVLRSLNA